MSLSEFPHLQQLLEESGYIWFKFKPGSSTILSESYSSVPDICYLWRFCEKINIFCQVKDNCRSFSHLVIKGGLKVMVGAFIISYISEIKCLSGVIAMHSLSKEVTFCLNFEAEGSLDIN